MLVNITLKAAMMPHIDYAALIGAMRYGAKLRRSLFLFTHAASYIYTTYYY